MMISLSFFIMMMMFITWMLMSINNPMNMSLTVISMAIITSLMMSLLSSSWYSLILLLIYVGGMMVMFSYFTSLCSNDPMKSKSKIHFILTPIMLMEMMKSQLSLPCYMGLQLNKMYFINNNVILLIITMILLSMMIVIIKMVKIFNVPLRGFSKKI